MSATYQEITANEMKDFMNLSTLKRQSTNSLLATWVEPQFIAQVVIQELESLNFHVKMASLNGKKPNLE